MPINAGGVGDLDASKVTSGRLRITRGGAPLVVSATAPDVTTYPELAIGWYWSDTSTSPPQPKVCTSLSPVTFARDTGETPAAHQLTGALHTETGQTAGQFLRATAATTFAFQAITFSAGGTLINPTAAINVIVWRAPFACTVTKVQGYRVGGTGATVNARLNGSNNHLSSALSLTSADAWAGGGAVQNTAYAIDDKLEIMLISLAGGPTQIGIEVQFTRP